MIKINIDIKNNFSLFSDLLKGKKIVLKNVVQLDEKKNNVMWLVGESEIRHESSPENILLVIEKSKRDAKYGVKLRCKSLTQNPFFRFDSDGPAHRNDFPEIPLEYQSISTPHYNSYREDGKPYAYKCEILQKETEAKAIVGDINLGIPLFCMHTITQLESGEFPTVIDKAPTFNFAESNQINFDNINFE